MTTAQGSEQLEWIGGCADLYGWGRSTSRTQALASAVSSAFFIGGGAVLLSPVVPGGARCWETKIVRGMRWMSTCMYNLGSRKIASSKLPMMMISLSLERLPYRTYGFMLSPRRRPIFARATTLQVVFSIKERGNGTLAFSMRSIGRRGTMVTGDNEKGQLVFYLEQG